MKLKGFTLAELMTTMAIVGLLATLTVPVIVHNTKRHHQQAMLRKAINTLNQAIAINIAKGKGDLYTYVDKEGVAPGIPEYLAQDIDTATGVKRLQRTNNWLSTSPYFETKDGIKYIFGSFTLGVNDPYLPEVVNRNNARCGTNNIRNIDSPNELIRNQNACPILIDTNKKTTSIYNENRITLDFYRRGNVPDGSRIDNGLNCISPCDRPGENGYFVIYLTNDSVYVPIAIQKFLGDIEE